MENLILSTTITVDAPAEKVWQALTDPEMIKQYFFGTRVDTDWKAGNPITWTGEWQGNAYQDKGKIVDVAPGKYVKYTYWSSMSGKEDAPEHYANITYRLKEIDGQTELEVTQDNFPDEAAKDHSEKSWQILLGGLKKLVDAGSL